jgi:hypothetical protein
MIEFSEERTRKGVSVKSKTNIPGSFEKMMI